jgi:hypothetical protein
MLKIYVLRDITQSYVWYPHSQLDTPAADPDNYTCLHYSPPRK